MCRRVIEIIREIEWMTSLHDLADEWLDEDRADLDDHSSELLEEFLSIIDSVIGVRSGGFHYLPLQTMELAGIRIEEMTLGRLAFHTRKGKIRVVKSY